MIFLRAKGVVSRAVKGVFSLAAKGGVSLAAKSGVILAAKGRVHLGRKGWCLSCRTRSCKVARRYCVSWAADLAILDARKEGGVSLTRSHFKVVSL